MGRRSLNSIYYNPRHPAGFSNANKLYKATKKKYSRQEIQQWLQHQDAYTLHRPARKKS